jgi:glycosyltransferase involved in cell wall biosynthesis
MDRTNVLVLMAAIGLGIPVIVSERIDPRRYNPGFPYNFLRRWLYRNATAVIVQSNGQADWFKQMSNRVAVIPNPVQACINDRNSQAGRTSIIIAVGRLTRQKGFDLLLTAFAKVLKEYPKWSLVIYGEGPERATLEKQIQKLKLDGKVKLPGVKTDLTAHFRTAGFFVLSSRFEGFPNVLIEALACGCPVVATNCSDSITGIVRHGCNGLLIPPEDVDAMADALHRLMVDEGLRRTMEKLGPDVICQFNTESVVEQWSRIFGNL